jgi:gluconokinase
VELFALWGVPGIYGDALNPSDEAAMLPKSDFPSSRNLCANQSSLRKKMILILMGVSGSGKSTVGQVLSSLTGWQFAEGDAYHSEVNLAKLSAGVALNDEDRIPWLVRLHDVLRGWHESGESGILTCSALKQCYRDGLCEGLPAESFRFVLLEGTREVFEERLGKREGHFMNPALLASQLATLELPQDALRVSVQQSPGQIAERILDGIAVRA